MGEKREQTGGGATLHRGVFNALKQRIDRNRLGDLLISYGALTPQQLRYALVRQQSIKAPLGDVLLRERMIRRQELYRALAEQWTFRTITALMTLMLTFAILGTKAARAGNIRDIPAQVSLVGVANAAFAPVEQYPPLFGSQERASANLKPFTKWTQMFERFEESLKTSAGQDVIHAFRKDLEDIKGQSLSVMAQKVNTLINKNAYIEDNRKWGMSDYWATPVEFLNRGGDCEDFAISKYTALRALGVPEDRLRLAIVHDLQKDIPHAILIVYTDDGALILDNQSSDVRPADSIHRYRPIFSINRTAWWLHTKPKETVLASVQ